MLIEWLLNQKSFSSIRKMLEKRIIVGDCAKHIPRRIHDIFDVEFYFLHMYSQYFLRSVLSILFFVFRYQTVTTCGQSCRQCFWLSGWNSLSALTRPQELGHWFCSQNLRLSSGIAFESDCQMTGRGSNLDSNSNQWVAEVLSAPKPNLCGVWIL